MTPCCSCLFADGKAREASNLNANNALQQPFPLPTHNLFSTAGRLQRFQDGRCHIRKRLVSLSCLSNNPFFFLFFFSSFYFFALYFHALEPIQLALFPLSWLFFFFLSPSLALAVYLYFWITFIFGFFGQGGCCLCVCVCFTWSCRSKLLFPRH